MGFPAATAQTEQPTPDPSRGHTNRRALFGVGDNFEEPDTAAQTGLGEETSEQECDPAVDGSTRVAPQSVVDAAISGSFPMSFEVPKPDDDRARDHTGDPRPDSDLRSTPAGEGYAADPYAHVWGLDEESSEAVSGSTQVAGASLAHAIMESKHDEISFSKARASGRKQQNTLMGINLDLYQEDKDSTRPIDRDKLAKIRDSVTSKTHGIPSVDFDPGDPPPDALSAEDDGLEETSAAPTQALSPAGLSRLEGAFDETSDPDKRQKLLKKLRSKKRNRSRDDHNTAPGIPAAPADSKTKSDQPPEKPATPAKPTPAEPSPESPAAPADWTSGPRFAIPKPASPSSGATREFETEDQPAEIAPDAIESLDPFESHDGFASQDRATEPGNLDQESFVTLEDRPSPWDTPDETSGINAPKTAFPIASPGATSDGAPAPLDATLGATSPPDPAPSASMPEPLAPPQTPALSDASGAQADAKIAASSGAKRSIKRLCILLALLGALIAGVGAIFLAGVPATICLVGGGMLCICAGLFLFALKWLS